MRVLGLLFHAGPGCVVGDVVVRLKARHFRAESSCLCPDT